MYQFKFVISDIFTWIEFVCLAVRSLYSWLYKCSFNIAILCHSGLCASVCPRRANVYSHFIALCFYILLLLFFFHFIYFYPHYCYCTMLSLIAFCIMASNCCWVLVFFTIFYFFTLTFFNFLIDWFQCSAFLIKDVASFCHSIVLKAFNTLTNTYVSMYVYLEYIVASCTWLKLELEFSYKNKIKLN